MVAPILIEPDSLYDDAALRYSLGISPGALAEGRRSGRLQFTRIGRRTFYRGCWVSEWFEQTSRSQRRAVPA